MGSGTVGRRSLPEGFTLAGYEALIGELLVRGYQVRGYDNVDREKPDLILRHDLDMSLDAALPIAEIERGLNAKSHFFVLIRTEMYNIFSTRAVCAIRHLQSLGHEIGLHLDASFYGDAVSSLEAGVRTECDVLEQVTGTPIRIISFHRPAKSLLGYAGTLAGRPHAYEPRFFSEIGYCSDSRNDWHFGHPLSHPAVREQRALQLLTHPIWWQLDGVDDAVAILDRFVEKRVALLRDELAANCEPYRHAIKSC
jgi:hypothetical protein